MCADGPINQRTRALNKTALKRLASHALRNAPHRTAVPMRLCGNRCVQPRTTLTSLCTEKLCSPCYLCVCEYALECTFLIHASGRRSAVGGRMRFGTETSERTLWSATNGGCGGSFRAFASVTTRVAKLCKMCIRDCRSKNIIEPDRQIAAAHKRALSKCYYCECQIRTCPHVCCQTAQFPLERN